MTDNQREATKLFYVVFKHITSLATGTIVILTTFVGTIWRRSSVPRAR